MRAKPAVQATPGSRVALLLIGFGSYLNLNAVQPLLPLFRLEFHASEIQVSLTVSASALAVALTAPLAGVVADRWGRKRIIVAAMLGIAVATALSATALTLPQLIAWRFLQGIFVPGAAAVILAYVSEEAPADAVGRTMATYITGTILGGFAGRFLNGLIAPLWGWRTAFLLLGAATFASGIGTGWRLPRRSAPGGSRSPSTNRKDSADPWKPGRCWTRRSRWTRTTSPRSAAWAISPTRRRTRRR